METTKGWHKVNVSEKDITKALTMLEENKVWMNHIFILPSILDAGQYLIVYKNEYDREDDEI